METKYCKYCDKDLDFSFFRIRVDKRRTPPFEYFSNKCKPCEAEQQQYNYNIKKDCPKFKAKHSSRVNKYNKETGYNKKLWEKRKNDSEYKAKLKDWREKNKNRVAELHKIRGSEWHIRNHKSITDSYCIARLLFKNTNPDFNREYILQNPELIEIKRTEILIYRLNKKILENGKE